MSKPSTRIPQIQVLRALAALLVLIYHAHLIPGGYIGVDIFYVISGFLITGLLLKELEAKGSLNLSAFYARRFKRLLPSSFLVVITTAIVGWLVLPTSMRHDFGRDVIAASTYISNFLFALWKNDYQNLSATPSPFIHYWSLAVEEQFYLFWPLAIAIFYKFGGRKLVIYGVASIAALSFLFSLWLTAQSPIWSFYILPTRAWELALGALITFIPKRFFQYRGLGVIAISVLVYGIFTFNEVTAFPGFAALVPVLATILLIGSAEYWPPFLSILAKSRVILYLGEISYPLYLWHWPALVIPSIYWSRPLTMLEKAFFLLITLVLSILTNRFVEKPIRNRSLATKRIFTLSALSTFVACALAGLIFLSYSNTVTFGGTTTYSLDEIRIKPKNDLDGCHIHVGQTLNPACEYGDTSAKKVIVLYGDSHAAQWLPSLDLIGKSRHFKIVSLTKSACPSAEVKKEISAQYKVADCQLYRDKTIQRISSIKPVALIATGMQPLTAPHSKVNSKSWWLAGEAKLYQRIKNLTQFPIYLSDTPLPHRNIPDCLVAKKGALCDDSTPISSEVAKGFIAINPTPWLCGTSCTAIIDGIVTYRDDSHISVAMSEHLAPRLESELTRIGVFG